MSDKAKEQIICDEPFNRFYFGEAWMMCRECGARLYSFDGNEDKDKNCPYKKDYKGQCTNELLTK